MMILCGERERRSQVTGLVCVRTAHTLVLNVTVLQDTVLHRETWLNQGCPGKGKGEGRGPKRSWQPTEEERPTCALRKRVSASG
jgi:hypothetical protein